MNTDLLPTPVDPTAVAIVDVRLADTEWTPLGDMTFEQWIAAGAELQRMGRAWQWWFGDWMLYGEHKFGDTYSQAIDTTGFDVQTLMNVTSVARRVAPETRRDSLSWSHHAEVASLEPGDQADWLDRAETEGMTVARLRSRLQGVPRDAPDPDQQLAPTHIGRVTIKFVAESDEHAHDRVKELAVLLERKGCTVTHKTAKAL